ncbi:MAG: hypothetical protein V4581_14840 [Bacteroidota bacterium]
MDGLKMVYFFFLAAVAVSCGGKEQSPEEAGIPTDTVISDTIIQKQLLVADKPVTNIIFDEFTVTLSCAKALDQQNLDSLQQQDSITVDLDIGETAEGQKLEIKGSSPYLFIVEQRYETSAGISFEGPYCEISDWKHYYSDWETLQMQEDGTYICKEYSLAENQKFPDVSIEELKAAVFKNCGEEGLKLIKDIKKVGDGPYEVGVSRIFLRITLRPQNGQTTTKIITLNIPAGC